MKNMRFVVASIVSMSAIVLGDRAETQSPGVSFSVEGEALVRSTPPTQVVAMALGANCNLIDFEGIANSASIGTIVGSPNVTFGPSWLGLIDQDAGGTGNFANEPTPSTVAFFLTPADPIDFDVEVQFVEVFYSASASSIPITLTAWDGQGGTGNVVDTAIGTTVGTASEGAPCTGDPIGVFCLWDTISLTGSSNNIRSITLAGAVANQFAFDSMTFCTDVGTGACCEDATETCVENLSQTVCELSGRRFGGVGTTCATISPTCGCLPSGDDCNSNGIADECESLPDCNLDLTPDTCDIATGSSSDCNNNGVPDECETPNCPYTLGPVTINAGGLLSDSDGNDYTLIASTGQSGGVGGVVSDGADYTAGDGFWHAIAPAGIPCLADTDCALADGDADAVCTCNKCVANFCTSSPIEYGNVNCAGPVNQVSLDDILCCLAGFANFSACPNADIHPTCTGNDIISLDDILSVLGAFAGSDPCGCVPL